MLSILKDDKKRLKSLGVLVTILLISVIAAIYYYLVLLRIDIPIHSDDAGSVVDWYNITYWGGSDNLGILQGRYSIIGILGIIFYNMFGMSEKMLYAVLVCRFFLCLIPTFYLSIAAIHRKRNWWILPISILLVVMQGYEGTACITITKFHLDPVIIFLYMLVIMQLIQDKIKSIQIAGKVLVGLLGVYSLIQGDILFIPIIILPFMLYAFIQLYNSEKTKSILLKTIVGFIIFGVFICTVNNLLFLFGKTSIDTLDVYGARMFPTIDEVVGNFWMYVKGVLCLFNANIFGKAALSVTTPIYLLKIAIIIFGYYSVVKKSIILFKGKEIEFVDAILSLNVVSITITYLIYCKQEDTISIRYANVILFTLSILICREMARALSTIKKLNENLGFKRKVISGIAVVSIALIICNVDNLYRHRDRMQEDELADVLIENNLQYGIGEFWSANISTFLTKGQSLVQAVNYANNEFEPYLNIWSFYKNKGNQYNFIIASSNGNFEINKQNIIKRFGKPNKVINVNDRDIYVFDYDIRSEIQKSIYNGEQSQEIVLNGQEIEYGIHNIIFEGENIGNMNADICSSNSSQGIQIELLESSDSKLVYEIKSNDNYDDVTIKLTGLDKNSKYSKYTIKTQLLANYVTTNNNVEAELTNNEEKETDIVELNAGTYQISLTSEDASNVNIKCFDINKNEISMEKIQDGKGIKVYKIVADENMQVLFLLNKLKNIDVNIEQITIEKAEVSDKIQYSFTSGGYDEEEDTKGNKWNWIEENSVLSIYNYSDVAKTVKMKFQARSGNSSKNKLIIQTGLKIKQYNISDSNRTIEFEITLQPGQNNLNLSTDAAKVTNRDDARNLRIMISNIIFE